MTRRLIIVCIAFTVLAAANTGAWMLVREEAPAALTGALPANAGGMQGGLILHAVTALLAAVAGAASVHASRLSTRITLGILFFITGVTLPVLGILAAGALCGILATTSAGGARAEDRYVFGNPEAAGARRENRRAKPETQSLAEAMRFSSASRLADMIQGLRGLEPPRRTLPLLRRFEQDEQASLQFAAQGVISSNVEELEHQLKELRTRADEEPHNPEPRLGAAECALRLVDWTAAGDATAAVFLREASTHLMAAGRLQPESVRLLELRARLELAEENGQAARATAARLRALTADSRAARLLELEAIFLQGDWTALARAAASMDDAPPEYRDSLDFWCAPRPA